MSPHPATLCIAGPTASGKTGVGIHIARALDGEVICCDAFSVYRHMTVLTAAPQAPADVPHHLVEMLEPDQRYDAARFETDCTRLIDEIRGRGRHPLVVGGTALYLRGWLKGFGAPVTRDEGLRAELEALAAREGAPAVHAILAIEDPVRAAELHPNDLRRIVRALEITRVTGQPASAQRTDWTAPDRHPAQVVYLVRERADLQRRIKRRTEAMFASGLVEEVDALRKRELSPEARKVLGLAEVEALLDGQLRLAEAKERITIRTRQFAKRQMTFFRSFDGALPIEVAADDTDEVIARRILDVARG